MGESALVISVGSTLYSVLPQHISLGSTLLLCPLFPLYILARYKALWLIISFCNSTEFLHSHRDKLQNPYNHCWFHTYKCYINFIINTSPFLHYPYQTPVRYFILLTTQCGMLYMPIMCYNNNKAVDFWDCSINIFLFLKFQLYVYVECWEFPSDRHIVVN